VRESLHSKILFRAVQVTGGTLALAKALGVSVTEIQAWMRSEAPIPEPVYFELLRTIADDAVGNLPNFRPSSG
jgi:hypothetical protein